MSKLSLDCHLSEDVVSLSPQGIAHVCNRDQLELVCMTTSSSVLDWIISIPGNTTIRRSLSTMSHLTQREINSTTIITFSRISNENTVPLVSRLLISSVSIGLNGTEVNCVVGDATLSTVVNIINGKDLILGTS